MTDAIKFNNPNIFKGNNKKTDLSQITTIILLIIEMVKYNHFYFYLENY